MMSVLWDLLGRQRITPEQLHAAVTAELQEDSPCFRTRQLIHESSAILRSRFGIQVDTTALSPPENRLGFPSLEGMVGEITSAETIKEFLRELGTRLTDLAEVTIGGSSSLILQGLLSRSTSDVDVVDEVPSALRNLRFDSETKLYIAHFQSHYLPDGWLDRRRSLGDFRKLRVYLVDGLDIFVGKLFSLRDKDRGDLRYLRQHFDKETVRQHLAKYGKRLAADPKLGPAASDNWYIQYGEELSLL